MRKHFLQKSLMTVLLGFSIAIGNGGIESISGEHMVQAATKQIKLSKNSVTVTLGKTITVKAQNTGNKKIKAVSSKTAVASVSVQGKNIQIKGKKAGTANVTVTAKGMQKCVVKVTVKNNAVDPQYCTTASSKFRLSGKTNSHNYDGYLSNGRWASTPTARLFSMQDGSFIRVESYGSKFCVEKFSASYKSQWVKKISQTLPLWGNVAYDGTYFYTVTGQNNLKEKKDFPCFAITKYDENWEQKGTVEVSNCYTTKPFDASNCSIAFSEDLLYVQAGREMYTSSDGRNHQANITIVVNKADMTLIDYPRKLTGYENDQYGWSYCSHSFNQIIRMDNDTLVSVNHGDAYPRAITLATTTDQEQYSMLSISGECGDNTTGATLGDFQVGNSSYLVCGTTVDQKEAKKDKTLIGKEKRNIFLAVMNKDSKKISYKQVTKYKSSDHLGNPYLVKITGNRFMLMWNVSKTLYYQEVDGDGDFIGKQKSIKNVPLTACEPIVANGKIQWFSAEKSKVHFYHIEYDDSDRDIGQPEICKFSGETSGLKIIWNNVKNADYYVLYKRNDAGEFEELAKVANSYYIDEAVEMGKNYTYTVQACQLHQDHTLYSDYDQNGWSEMYLKPVEQVELFPYSERGTGTWIEICWEPQPSIEGYCIYRQEYGSDWKKVAEIEDPFSTSWIDMDAKKSTVYRYSVAVKMGEKEGNYEICPSYYAIITGSGGMIYSDRAEVLLEDV